MIRFAITIFLLLWIAGCQTAGRTPQPTASAKHFWDKTAQFFQPLMPDTEKQGSTAERQFAASRPPAEMLPVNRSPNSLYNASSVFTSQFLATQEPVQDTINVKTTESALTTNPMQIQSGDSEAFQGLLREIAVVPDSKRNVDKEKLADMLTSFREDIMDSEVEDEYLALLRKRILPEVKSAAPLPSVMVAEAKRSSQQFDELFYDDDDDFDDVPMLPVARRRMPNLDEPMIAQNTTAMPLPAYPALTQAPGGSPGIVQAGYQAAHVPSNSAMTGYGAGDWQAPLRVAREQLQYAIGQTPNGRTLSNEMRLRMLDTLLDNKSEAVKPMQSADKTINDFMANQVLGLSALLDDTAPDSRVKYVSAAYRFGEGLQNLQTLCPIMLKNVALIEQCFGHGQFVARSRQEFYPGEKFHVYMEIENSVVLRMAAEGTYSVAWAMSYEIRDSNAKVVVKQDMGTPGERTLSRRRDYFQIVSDVLPKNLSPGEYYLRISVIDLNDDSMQYAEEQILFKVAPAIGGEG